MDQRRPGGTGGLDGGDQFVQQATADDDVVRRSADSTRTVTGADGVVILLAHCNPSFSAITAATSATVRSSVCTLSVATSWYSGSLASSSAL